MKLLNGNVCLREAFLGGRGKQKDHKVPYWDRSPHFFRETLWYL